MLSPINFLLLVLLITAAAGGAHIVNLIRRRRVLQSLVAGWQMHYSRYDRLRLGDRVTDSIPLPGLFDIRVIDLLFRTDTRGHRYLFTIEYGLGVVRAKRRSWRVAGFQEPLSRGQSPAPANNIILAPAYLPLEEAYRYVYEALESTPN